MNKWKSIKSAKPADNERVDVWMYIYASPRSMGMADAFKVNDAWRDKGKWYHDYKGKPTELFDDYVTHWSAIPSPEANPEAPTVALW